MGPSSPITSMRASASGERVALKHVPTVTCWPVGADAFDAGDVQIQKAVGSKNAAFSFHGGVELP